VIVRHILGDRHNDGRRYGLCGVKVTLPQQDASIGRVTRPCLRCKRIDDKAQYEASMEYEVALRAASSREESR
jgi:hypothetical protein